MTAPPCGDDGMQIIARQPQPSLLHSASTNPELQSLADPAVDRPLLSRTARIVLIAGILLTVIIVAAGVAYWIQSQRYPVVVTIGVPDNGASGDPLGRRPGPLVPVNPEMLHLSSIALGNPRLTIVNGKRLAEGEWLVISTPRGDASVRIIQIEDGLVRFKHGGETMSAKLQPAQKPNH
jgi:hypothetical protein